MKRKQIKKAFILKLVFAILELICGIYINSTAIISDSINDFCNSISIGISLILDKITKRKPNTKYTLGLKRLTLIAAIFNIFILSVGAFYIISGTISNFTANESIKITHMFILSIIGLMINYIALSNMKNSKNILNKTIKTHMIEDIIGWVLLLIVSVIIYFTNWYYLDSILAIIMAIIITKNIIKHLIDVYIIIMQANPNQLLYKEIISRILSIDNTITILDCNFYTLDLENHIFTIKIISNNYNIYSKINTILNEYNIFKYYIDIIVIKKEVSLNQ